MDILVNNAGMMDKESILEGAVPLKAVQRGGDLTWQADCVMSKPIPLLSSRSEESAFRANVEIQPEKCSIQPSLL